MWGRWLGGRGFYGERGRKWGREGGRVVLKSPATFPLPYPQDPPFVPTVLPTIGAMASLFISQRDAPLNHQLVLNVRKKATTTLRVSQALTGLRRGSAWWLGRAGVFL